MTNTLKKNTKKHINLLKKKRKRATKSINKSTIDNKL